MSDSVTVSHGRIQLAENWFQRPPSHLNRGMQAFTESVTHGVVSSATQRARGAEKTSTVNPHTPCRKTTYEDLTKERTVVRRKTRTGAKSPQGFHKASRLHQGSKASKVEFVLTLMQK